MYFFSVLSPKPIDQEPETSLIGLIIAILTTIILVLIVAIFFIVTRQKRTRTAAVLDALQHNLHSDGLSLGLDKRFNSNFKVSYLFYYISFYIFLNAGCIQSPQPKNACNVYTRKDSLFKMNIVYTRAIIYAG